MIYILIKQYIDSIYPKSECMHTYSLCKSNFLLVCICMNQTNNTFSYDCQSINSQRYLQISIHQKRNPGSPQLDNNQPICMWDHAASEALRWCCDGHVNITSSQQCVHYDTSGSITSAVYCNYNSGWGKFCIEFFQAKTLSIRKQSHAIIYYLINDN